MGLCKHHVDDRILSLTTQRVRFVFYLDTRNTYTKSPHGHTKKRTVRVRDVDTSVSGETLDVVYI